MLDAGDAAGIVRPAAGRDQDLVGGVAAAVDLDRVRIDDDAAPLDQLDTGRCSASLR